MASKDADELLKEAIKEERPVQYLETGDVGLDLALTDGKGLPIGSSVLLWATPGVGKTTVVGDLCKRLIANYSTKKEPFKVLYIDTEDSTGLLSSLGLDKYKKSKDFIHLRKQLCWRQIEGIYNAILNKEPVWGDIKVVVIDSVGNVLSDQNVKNSIADGDYGTRARERSSFYSKFLPRCKEEGVSTFLISQARQKQNAGMYEDPNKPAVSNVDLHNVDIIIKCTSKNNTTDASKIEETTIFGTDKVASKYIMVMDSKATGCKNRYIKGHAVELMVEKGKKIHNYYTVRKMLEGNKFLKASGGWYTFSKEICEGFGIPDSKLRVGAANKIVDEHIGELIAFLKKVGKYKVGLEEVEVPVTEEDLKEKAVETENGESANE